MREFKFRAWDGKTMIYNVTPWQQDFVLVTNAWRCLQSNGDGILGSGGTEAIFEVAGNSFKELMQYSGLTDKHGKEIYEGDVFRYVVNGFLNSVGDLVDEDVIYTEEVHFLNGGFELDACPLGAFHEEGEVIGNIYQNLELIK